MRNLKIFAARRVAFRTPVYVGGLLLAGLTTFFIPRDSHACMCRNSESFIEVAPNASVIVRGRIKRHITLPDHDIPTIMEVEILEIISGQEKRKLIRVHGDNGMQCRPYVMKFAPGSEWVLALNPNRIVESNNTLEARDYFINGCGAYWLPVKNGTVGGRIFPNTPAEKERGITVAELRRRLNDLNKAE